MTFRITPEYYRCTMSEKENLILDLHLPRQWFKQKDRKPLTSYSVKDGNLIKTVLLVARKFVVHPSKNGR